MESFYVESKFKKRIKCIVSISLFVFLTIGNLQDLPPHEYDFYTDDSVSRGDSSWSISVAIS